MRENMGLYHGKRTDTNEWIEGCLVVDEKGNTYIGHGISAKTKMQFSYGGRNRKTLNRFVAFGFFMVNPETVGQYTGLTDKNGKKIFEGDIVRYSNGFGHIGWAQVHGAFMCVEESGEYWEWLDNMYDIEVIGNITDNPELLKGNIKE